MSKEPPPINVPSGPEHRKKEREAHPGEQLVKQLRMGLCHRYGSVPRAWRKKLSPQGDLKISFDDFSDAFKVCKLTGDFAAAWQVLGAHAGLSLEELEPAVKHDFREFREKLALSYGSLEKALDTADADGSFTFKFKEFKSLCDYVQFRRNERRLFDYLAMRSESEGADEVNLGTVFEAEALHVKQKRAEDERRKKCWKEAQEKRLEASRRRVAGLPPLDEFDPAEFGEDGEDDEDD